MKIYPDAVRLEKVLETVEDVYKGLTGDYEEAYGIIDTAVYLQIAVDRLVWKLNKIMEEE